MKSTSLKRTLIAVPVLTFFLVCCAVISAFLLIDDATLFAIINSAPIHKEGELTGVRLTATNVTSQKKLEAQLQQAQKMESIGNLAGGIAHEFNNMLAIIMGNNELVMEEVPQGSLARVYVGTKFSLQNLFRVV